MTISISGLGSGLDYASWIEDLVQLKQDRIDEISANKTTMATSKSTLLSLKSSYTDLLTSVQKITDSAFGATSDLFAQKSATSSSTNTVTASATALAAKQSISVEVSQLATATKATSATAASATMTGTTTLSSLANGTIKNGTMSLYVNNTKYSVSVASTDTVNDVLGRINDLKNSSGTSLGLSATVTDGKIDIKTTNVGDTLTVGSTSDTTNFKNVVSLVKNTDESYTSSKTILQSSSSATLTSATTYTDTIKEGSFKIGNATFTIDSTTTMSGIINKINQDSNSGVTAYWDSSLGKMVLTSTSQGASNINVENLAGNFTDVMGFTTSTYDVDGNVTSSSLKTGSQTLGDYAKLKINGTDFVSASNTVTSDISGLTGVTLTLADETTSATTITIGSDNSSLNNAVKSFISAFNTILSKTDTATATDGDLEGESTLKMIRSSLRSMVTATAASGTGAYKSISSLGITTGSIGSSISDDTEQLTLDADKLTAALADNPDAVKKLLIGDGTNDGVLTKIATKLNNVLSTSGGYFITRRNSFDSQITRMENDIESKTTALTAYQTNLQTKFSVMDTLISKLKAQSASLYSTLGISTAASSTSK